MNLHNSAQVANLLYSSYDNREFSLICGRSRDTWLLLFKKKVLTENVSIVVIWILPLIWFIIYNFFSKIYIFSLQKIKLLFSYNSTGIDCDWISPQKIKYRLWICDDVYLEGFVLLVFELHFLLQRHISSLNYLPLLQTIIKGWIQVISGKSIADSWEKRHLWKWFLWANLLSSR